MASFVRVALGSVLGFAIGVVAIGAIVFAVTDAEFSSIFGSSDSDTNTVQDSSDSSTPTTQSPTTLEEQESEPSQATPPSEASEEEDNPLTPEVVESIYREDFELFYEYKDKFEQRLSDTENDWASKYRSFEDYFNKMAHVLYDANPEEYQEYSTQYEQWRDAMEAMANLHEQNSTPEALETMRK